MEDRAKIMRVVEIIDENFRSCFGYQKYQSSHGILKGHFDILSEVKVLDFLRQFQLSETKGAFDDKELIHILGIRCTNRCTNKKWRLSCLVEESAHLDNGLYLQFDAIYIGDAAISWQFDATINDCMSTLGLEESIA